MCDNEKKKRSLPPKVMGKVCGYLTLKVGRIVWSMKDYKNIVITIGWWGESKPLMLRPCIMDRNKFEKIENEIIYEIRTDPGTFEQYLRDCECLEFNVVNEEVNESIGKISVPDITSIITESRFGGCFSIINSEGFIVGDIFITLDLFLYQNYSLKEMRFQQNNDRIGTYPYTTKERICKSMSAILKNKKNDQISELQNETEFNVACSKSLFRWFSCDDDYDDEVTGGAVFYNNKDDKALKQITANKRSIEKEDSVLNDDIQKAFHVDMKEVTPSDVIGGTVQHHEAVKQANSLRISILSLSLNNTMLHHENTSLKNFRSHCNSLYQHIVRPTHPSSAVYFVEYEIPALLNITASKSDISRNSCPWNKRVIRFCSRKQTGSDINFAQSSVHHLPRRKECWLESLKDLKIMMKVFLRNSNHRVPLQIGNTTLEMCNVMNSESLSLTSESPVFSLGQMPHPFCIGKLRTKIELGRDCKYFGKEFFKVIVNGDNSAVKEGGIKQDKVQENSEKMFKDLHLSEKEQQEQNKENLPEPQMIQQYVEKPLLLYGLIYISSGRGFNIMNSYIVSKSFWKEDIAVSNICWETSVPNYSLRELIPVLLSAEFLERCRSNFIIVEVWERKPVAQNDTLIGIAKLPLNQFFVAFRNPLLTEQLIQAKYPVVGVDGWVNIFNPVTRLQTGQLHAVLCLGTEDQIQLIERVRGIMETSYVPTRMQPSNSGHYDFSSFATKPENFNEASVTQCHFNSAPKQVVTPSKSDHIDESAKVPLNVHPHSEINQDSIQIQNYDKNLTNPYEGPFTKQCDASFVPNMNAKPHSLKQNVDENINTGNNRAYELPQSTQQEKHAEQVLDTISAISENIKSSKLNTDKQQSNLSATKAVDGNTCAEQTCAEQTCTVKNQQCQTDVFVLDLQHYGPDFLTKHKNIEPLLIKLSSRGLEIMEINESNANAELLDTKSCDSNIVKNKADEKENPTQLDKNITCFQQHNSQSLGYSSASEATYAFSFSGAKEDDILNSGDDTVANDDRGDSNDKFSTENYNSAKMNKHEVNNDHKVKSIHDTEREHKATMYSSDQNSMKQHKTSAASETTNSKRVDPNLKCSMGEFVLNTDQAHACHNYLISEDESEREKYHSGDSPTIQSEFASNTGSSNLLIHKCDLNEHNSSDQASFNSKKTDAFEDIVNSNEASLSKNETNQVAKDHKHFKNTETPREVSGDAEFPSYVIPECAVVSANNNFCASIKIHEAINLSLYNSDEVGRHVYVSFHLNHGCAKVIVDGEVQLKTGLLFTPVVACNGNPVWNWHCEAWLPSDLLTDTSKQLIMKIWQKSNKSDVCSDICLGLASIDLTVMLLGMPWLCEWFNIVDFSGSCVGHIKVSVKPQENLDRFRLDRINMLPDSNVIKSQIETSFHQNCSYPQAVNSDLTRKEQYHTNVQKIDYHLPERPPDRKICFVKHTKTASKASSLIDVKIKNEKNVPFGWDLDFPEDVTSLLTKALRQKLSELDEITKRLKSRLLTVTSESISPDNLVWEQEEDIPYCKRSDQKQNFSTHKKNCVQICTEAKVNSPKNGSCNAAHILPHRNCYCTQSSTASPFQHSSNACELKHLDHLSNKMDFSKLSQVLDNETSYEQMQCNCERTSEHQFGNQCLQYNESNTDLEIGKKDSQNNDAEGAMNKDNDVEDFDALTDVLMETATKELDIANVFNPLLFQHLLLSNTNLIQRRCQRDKCGKQETVHNLSDSQNGSEIMVKYDETLLSMCTVKEIDDKVQDNVSCSSENNHRQCNEKICHSDLKSFHKMSEIDKFKKLGSYMISEKQQPYEEKLITNKGDPTKSPKTSKQLSSVLDTSNIAESSLESVQIISDVKTKCNPQQCHQLKMPINGQSFQHKVSASNENVTQESFSEQQLSESIKTHKEEIESCSEITSVTRKEELLQGDMKEAVEVTNIQTKNGEYDNKEYPPDLQRKQKQRAVVCRLAPLFFQKLNTKHD